MARYHLRNPKNDNEILIQLGQSSDEPIYKGKDSNDFFILKWGRDFTRQLHPFDPQTGKVTGEPTSVPNNWTGEPRVIGIDEDTWSDIQALAQQNDANAQQLLDQLIRDLIDGDIIRLTRDGATTGHLRAQRNGGQWTLIRS